MGTGVVDDGMGKGIREVGVAAVVIWQLKAAAA